VRGLALRWRGGICALLGCLRSSPVAATLAPQAPLRPAVPRSTRATRHRPIASVPIRTVLRGVGESNTEMRRNPCPPAGQTTRWGERGASR
jgi:hypothetical protein